MGFSRTVSDIVNILLALANYEGRVVDYISRLDSKISGSLGRPLNVTNLFGFFSFDVMGDLSFGKQFNMLESEKQHIAVDTLRQGMSVLGLFTPVPWLFIILINTPGLMRRWNEMILWSTQEVDRRIKVCKFIVSSPISIAVLLVLSQAHHRPSQKHSMSVS